MTGWCTCTPPHDQATVYLPEHRRAGHIRIVHFFSINLQIRDILSRYGLHHLTHLQRQCPKETAVCAGHMVGRTLDGQFCYDADSPRDSGDVQDKGLNQHRWTLVRAVPYSGQEFCLGMMNE
jgi:hypothetical protein